MKSIQSRLLWGIALCTSLAWAGMALMTYQLEKQQLHQAFDEELMAAARLADAEMVKKLFDDIAPRYVDRNGGYTRMLKLGQRKGDSAEMVILELVE